MWEELIQAESKGKLVADDLIWHPDVGVQMPAYVQESQISWNARRSGACTYWSILPSQTDGILGFTSASSIESASSSSPFDTLWISPYVMRPNSDTHRDVSVSTLYDPWVARLIGNESAELDTEATVDAYFWDHFGAGPTTQLALLLWSANRWLKNGKEPSTCLMPVGLNLITEVSKLRAARIVLDHLCSLYATGASSNHVRKSHSDQSGPGGGNWMGRLVAVSSASVLGAADPANNMVRNTVSAVAGMCGGADILSVQPWNVLEKGYSDEEARRLSINLFHLLAEESKLNEVSDPMSGSYFVEELTGKLIKSSWQLFNEFESASLSDMRSILSNRILPRDHQLTTASETGKESKPRVKVGETHFKDETVRSSKVDLSPFPMPNTFPFKPLISNEVKS